MRLLFNDRDCLAVVEASAMMFVPSDEEKRIPAEGRDLYLNMHIYEWERVGLYAARGDGEQEEKVHILGYYHFEKGEDFLYKDTYSKCRELIKQAAVKGYIEDRDLGPDFIWE